MQIVSGGQFLCSNCALPLVSSGKLGPYPHEQSLFIHLRKRSLSDMHHLEVYTSYQGSSSVRPSSCAPIGIVPTFIPIRLGNETAKFLAFCPSLVPRPEEEAWERGYIE